MYSNSTKATRFSIAENDFYFKQFLVKMLLENPLFSIVNDCNNGNELINRLYRKQEDVFIINLFMPILSGIEAIKYIRQSNKDIPILTYSTTYQEDMAATISDIPNTFYCQKNSIIIKDILRNYMDRQKKQQEELNVTEIQIIKLCYEGFSNKEIGDRINLSTRTIDTYVNRLTEKLGLKSKLDLARFCVENGYYNSSI